MKRKTKERLGYAALNLAFILLCLVTLIPIYYAVNVSFSGPGSSLSGDFTFLPEDPSLENYRAILFDEPFLLWLKNSLLLSAGTVAIAMLCAVTAAYACSRWRFRGRRSLLMALLVLNAFPQVLTLFAYYRILRLAGLLNSHAGLMLIYAGSCLGVAAQSGADGFLRELLTHAMSRAEVKCYANEAGIHVMPLFPVAGSPAELPDFLVVKNPSEQPQPVEFPFSCADVFEGGDGCRFSLSARQVRLFARIPED